VIAPSIVGQHVVAGRWRSERSDNDVQHGQGIQRTIDRIWISGQCVAQMQCGRVWTGSTDGYNERTVELQLSLVLIRKRGPQFRCSWVQVVPPL